MVVSSFPEKSLAAVPLCIELIFLLERYIFQFPNDVALGGKISARSDNSEFLYPRVAKSPPFKSGDQAVADSSWLYCCNNVSTKIKIKYLVNYFKKKPIHPMHTIREKFLVFVTITKIYVVNFVRITNILFSI